MEPKIKDPAQFLAEELERRIKKNPKYSLRSFALALKLSPGELSEIIHGKRRLSLKGALKVIKALAFSPSEAEQFLRLVQSTEANHLGVALVSPGLKVNQLSEDLFHIISDWYCFAILSLTEVKGFRFEIGYIAKNFGISVTEVKLALDRLERVGLIVKKNGKLHSAPDCILSPDEISSEAVRSCHRQILEKATQSLESQSIAEREVGGITFAIHEKKIPELKRDLKKFLDDWAEKVSRPAPQGKTDVYQLETILFRLNKKGDRV
jgi:uncharacterized protein (TIGR02147 family)